MTDTPTHDPQTPTHTPDDFPVQIASTREERTRRFLDDVRQRHPLAFTPTPAGPMLGPRGTPVLDEEEKVVLREGRGVSFDRSEEREIRMREGNMDIKGKVKEEDTSSEKVVSTGSGNGIEGIDAVKSLESSLIVSLQLWT